MNYLSMLMGIFLYAPTMVVQALVDSIEMPQAMNAWTMHCAQCHNLRSPTEFNPKSWQTILLHMRLQAGISKEDAQNILAFLTTDDSIKTQKVQNKMSVQTQSGEEIYKQTCVACHGTTGKGVSPGAPDFTASNSPLKNSDAVLLERILNGYQASGDLMAMPPKGGNPQLTEEEAKSVLEYIRAHF